MVDVTCSDVVGDGVRIGKRFRGYVLTLYFSVVAQRVTL